MELCKFAEFGLKIAKSGHKGLDCALRLHRAAHAAFGEDWTGLFSRAEGVCTGQGEKFEELSMRHRTSGGYA